MKSPFVFGKIVSDKAFINRRDEIKRLSGNFENSINTILISPRRWGKSSLVKKTAVLVMKRNSKVKICFLDMFRIRSEEEFYQRLSTEIIKSTSGKLEEWVITAKKYLGRFSPKITFGSDPTTDFGISFNFSENVIDIDEILNLAENIARKKGLQIIVCIDEFQDADRFKDSLNFQKQLRSVWQHHKFTSYCLYGSKKHMMINLFENQAMPFYKFGDVIYLLKIAPKHFVDFIVRSFKNTEKKISKEYAIKFIELMDNHPYYVQQFAHLVWINTEIEVTNDIIISAIDDIIAQNAMLYYNIIDNLSETQINFLSALVDGIQNFSSIKIMQNYKLGTSGNVSKVKKVLTEKEIITIEGNLITFLDPVLKLWFVNSFQEKKII